jgi:hypothetical protein
MTHRWEVRRPKKGDPKGDLLMSWVCAEKPIMYLNADRPPLGTLQWFRDGEPYGEPFSLEGETFT